MNKAHFVNAVPRLYKDAEVLLVGQGGNVYRGRIVATKTNGERLVVLELSVIPNDQASEQHRDEPAQRLLDKAGDFTLPRLRK